MTEPFEWTVAETARHIAGRRVSSREVVAALQAQIAQHEPSLQAWALLAGEAAAAEAAACDDETAQGISRGALHGVPVAIKDNLDVAALPTRAGSDLTGDAPATTDAAAVARLRAAGAIVLGKTAMTAFAAMDPAATRNPWHGGHTPGGSSSGSAAAVAARMCGAALGTQTAGSVLRPAAYCGVVGLKPTYGAVSRDGLVPCAWSMDHVGVIARDVADTELMFGVLSGGAPRAGEGNAPLVVGIPDRGFEPADADASLAFDRAVAVLTDAGASFITVDLPDDFETLSAAGIVTMYAEMAAFHRELFLRRAADYPPRLRVLVEAGLKLSASDYLDAQRIRRRETARLSALLDRVTVLLTPATATPAPAGQARTGDWRFNLPFSTSGHPAIALPCGLSAGGLPLGLQAVAAHGREDRLFAFGRRFQQHSDWHARRAPLTTMGID
jgi:aspartyl-tRNA(Asn)/glutamyl-tRNA(Gln) amidotransferase subunit A